jgi:hypothetical protein
MKIEMIATIPREPTPEQVHFFKNTADVDRYLFRLAKSPFNKDKIPAEMEENFHLPFQKFS